MSVLSREERDALIGTLARRWHLWDMHRVKETLTEAPRTFNPGYTDFYLLYDALTRDFDEADRVSGSREELLSRLEALARRLEAQYVVALRHPQTRSEFEAMVAEMRRTIGTGSK